MQEDRSRRGILEAIDRWWDAFTRSADLVDAHFTSRKEFDLASLMVELQSIDKELMWEFGPAVTKKGHRLCITPESSAELRPLLEVVLKKAPQLARWEFYPYRLSDAVGDDPKIIDGRTSISAEGVTVTISRGIGNRIDLTYFLPIAATEREAGGFAFVTTERLVGEEILDQWIGGIRAVDGLTESGSLKVPLDRLKPTVDSIIDSIHSQLPGVPRYQLTSQPGNVSMKGALFKLEVSAREDNYPGWSDQFVGISPEADLWKATRSGNFYSVRFSRIGETFCYLKIDGSTGLDSAHFADRGELEDAITGKLSEAGLGCAYGGGTGKIYSYIELALVDVERSIPVLREIFRNGNISKRSWLLFHDRTLSEEWVGLFEDTPLPPR